jgi:hypothetical protein
MTRALEHLHELARPLTPRCGERCVATGVHGVDTGAGSE